MRKALERITIKPPLHWIKFHIMDTKGVYIFLVVLLYESNIWRKDEILTFYNYQARKYRNLSFSFHKLHFQNGMPIAYSLQGCCKILKSDRASNNVGGIILPPYLPVRLW